jgi:hypothetical protein
MPNRQSLDWVTPLCAIGVITFIVLALELFAIPTIVEAIIK